MEFDQQSSQIRILTVCAGNVCRSPYMMQRLRASGIRAAIASAGVTPLEGHAMAELVSEQLQADGIDDPHFEARKLTVDELRRTDLVLVAAAEHRGDVARMLPAVLPRLFTMATFAQLAQSALDRSEVIRAEGDDRERFDALLALVHEQRPFVSMLQGEEMSLIDPWQRSKATYQAMMTKVDELMVPIVELFDRFGLVVHRQRPHAPEHARD